jgi:NTP pyrophosphatase (non-canonical NTP hydrolase)
VINMPREELADILDDMAARVRAGDSLEGSIEYLLADPDADHPHQVRAAYRVGNRMGQGGMVLIGQEETPNPESSSPAPADLWATIAELVRWLNEANGSGPHQTAMSLLKLTEEVGEVSQAYLGLEDQNPRRGVTHTEADVADELCDVIVTAMVVLHGFTAAPEKHLAAKIQRIADRSAAHALEQQ